MGHVAASAPGRISRADRLEPAEPRREHERRRDGLASDRRCDESSGPIAVVEYLTTWELRVVRSRVG